MPEDDGGMLDDVDPDEVYDQPDEWRDYDDE